MDFPIWTYIIVVPVFLFVWTIAYAELQTLGGWRQGDLEWECIEDNVSTGCGSIGSGKCAEYVLLALPIVPGDTDNNLLLVIHITNFDCAHYDGFLILDNHILQRDKVAFDLLSKWLYRNLLALHDIVPVLYGLPKGQIVGCWLLEVHGPFIWWMGTDQSLCDLF